MDKTNTLNECVINDLVQVVVAHLHMHLTSMACVSKL
jgi:hypothetical protein